MQGTLSNRIAAQVAHSERQIAAVLASGHSRSRVDFGQQVTVVPGAVLASPVVADWNPEPDYFFHWARDSAIVMDVAVELARRANAERRQFWLRHFAEYVAFSQRALTLADATPANPLIETAAGLRQYLRPDAELAALRGDLALGEPRCNPDGTPDPFCWARPQYDGPALRALACLNFLDAGGAAFAPETADQLWLDLDFTARFAGAPCIGPWEESGERDRHYFTGICQLGALSRGADWAVTLGEDAKASGFAHAAQQLAEQLSEHWDAGRASYRARSAVKSGFDAAIFMGVLHAELTSGPHSLTDPKLAATVAVMEAHFVAAFPINQGRDAGILIGRNAADQYFGGNPWLPTSLALASYYYRLSRAQPAAAAHNRARGDAIMAALAPHITEDGALPEQIDKITGAPVSARQLTWSHAAFITAAMDRDRAIAG